MKNISHNTILPLLGVVFLLFTATTCEKQNPAPVKPTPDYNTLPPYTTEGKNTFGCKINGKVFVPFMAKKPCPLCKELKLDCGGHAFSLGASQSNDTINRGVSIYLRNGFFHGKGRYTLDDVIGRTTAHYSDVIKNLKYNSYTSRGVYDTLSHLNVLYYDDKVNFVAAGTFDLTLYRFDSTKMAFDTMRITEGRFDVKFGY